MLKLPGLDPMEWICVVVVEDDTGPDLRVVKLDQTKDYLLSHAGRDESEDD